MEVIQNILIVILAGYMTVDQNGPVVLSWFSVIVGMISGLIMGDMNTGLMIGGTFQLMSLGVAALGGASAPYSCRHYNQCRSAHLFLLFLQSHDIIFK